MKELHNTDGTDAAPLTGPAHSGLHAGVVMTGDDGINGRKAFLIHIHARDGAEDGVARMLQDILARVNDEPATGPWYGVRYGRDRFAIFEVFPDVRGRDAHVNGGGGDIFRDVQRMNALLVEPAHVEKVDVLLSKDVIAGHDAPSPLTAP